MKRILVAVTIVTLTACAPVFRNFYTYEPMKKESQRTCAVNCQVLKQSCELNQQSSYQLCQANARTEYNNCKASEVWGYDKKGNYECKYNCYCYESSCSEPDPDQCESQYATCYRTCGGKVTVESRCVENCEKLQGPQPPKT